MNKPLENTGSVEISPGRGTARGDGEAGEHLYLTGASEFAGRGSRKKKKIEERAETFLHPQIPHMYCLCFQNFL